MTPASVVITDTLPSTGTFVSASNGGTNTSGVITWPTLATMTSADTVSYTVTFVAHHVRLTHERRGGHDRNAGHRQQQQHELGGHHGRSDR